MRKVCLAVFAYGFFLAGGADGVAATPDPPAPLQQWLAAQQKVSTWSADFVQIRALKTLTQPLKTEGKVWFCAPDNFRWELGDPPQTIAVRARTELLLFYPRLKRVERFPLTASTGQWREALSLLEAGFPRNEAQLRAQYDIVSEDTRDAVSVVDLRPKSSEARKMIPLIRIEFNPQELSLSATELRFADGSSMRNEFRNPKLNPQLEADLFNPPIPPEFKIEEPLSKQRKRATTR